jgi:hypothetical protein
MSTNASIKIDAWLAAGFGLGLYYFYKGLRTFREYRVLMDTPETPIRSLAMGLVEIHGKATGGPPIASPVTQSPCYFYQVDIERWVQSKNGGRWVHTATDADGERFYLADATGKVLVDAHHAEYDLIQTARVEARNDSGSVFSRLFSPAQSLNEAAELPGTDLFTYASKAVARCKHGGLFDWTGSARERYRLTEHLVIPDHWYDLTGTCVENPECQDEGDHNLIVKGTNEPTFLITWRSEKEIRCMLRSRASRYVFGGALLAVACLAVFLAKSGAF